jgi:hypothetical protein
MINFFVFFRVMEHRWNEIDRGKPEVLGEKPVPVPRFPPQVPARDRTRTSAVKGRRLTARAMARPLSSSFSRKFQQVMRFVVGFHFLQNL